MRIAQGSNPWIPQRTGYSAITSVDVPPTGPVTPQPGVIAPPPTERLGTYDPVEAAAVFAIGTHGGSGESTISELLGGAPTGHRWPSATPPPPVLLAARTHARGLRSAQMAARSWASGQTPPVQLIGLVLIADSPGKLPRELADLAAIVGGGVPHVWLFPWQEHLRLDKAEHNHSRSAQKVLAEINQVLKRINGQGA